jgi:acyl-CoA synthetase (AMP-forming)/AMP-acid ligase II
MTGVRTTTVPPHSTRLNVADRLTKIAAAMPDAVAVACPHHSSLGYGVRRGASGLRYAMTRFAEMDAEATRLARGLAAWGVPPGTRLALLVRPGIEFVTLVFALLRAGIVIVLIDPGLGRRNVIRCLQEAKPEGFVAIGLAQAARLLLRHKFPLARWNVTIGRRWFWGGKTFDQLLTMGDREVVAPRSSLRAPFPDDPAAIIFTSGSTGPPKGVLYTHRMFDTQVAEIQATYDIRPGSIDLACFPLFALFNSAMGVTTVLPEMDFSRPASADPRKLLAAANDWQVTQAFASPAVWRNVGEYCANTGERIPTLRQVFSCGAPVPANVLRQTLACVADGAKMHTPYGATECLPIATIEADEVLAETAQHADAGRGICVGRKFDSIGWRIIRITDEPIATIDDAEELPPGETGELIVRGPQVSPRYVTELNANATSKIADSCTEYSVQITESGDKSASREQQTAVDHWHRTGDVGYLDEQARFWYCGRKSQRVETSAGTMYTEVYEAIFNEHPAVRRSALIGIGPRGNQKPVMILESNGPISDAQQTELEQILHDDSPTPPDGEIMVVDWPLPVDIRHNAKINREQLAAWAAKHIPRSNPKASNPRR